MTTDINVAGRRNLKFPPICVVCEKENPDTAIEINITGAVTEPILIEAASIALAERTYSANTSNRIAGIPVCAGCSGALKRYHRIVKIATYTAWIPGLILLILLPVPIWIRVGIFLAFVIAPGIIQVIVPPAFGATFLNDKATFEFKSKRCAEEFAKLNQIPYETNSL